ncbi:hypothetical protein [Actinokineospora xionganensis]|uniref:SnoaL-like domain-containing protein n=1 Tax=Actinokineospora xionganensis TaxID=2684470 RepID=A0ABR7L945_9PSEU|nr:hypothetical protein [Actinokineospora xionganensis]MBC6449230.1 hypothetical protein [Actinokineospora xionganensis]
MRSVSVFPRLDQADIVAMLDALSPHQNDPWLVDDVLYVDLDFEYDGFLYRDWEPEAIEHLAAAIGHRPAWAVDIQVSGRVDGTEQLGRLVLTLLDAGGAAMDDYSDHAWRASDIRSDARFEGLSFFDFRGFHRASGQHTRLLQPERSGHSVRHSGPARDAYRA